MSERDPENPVHLGVNSQRPPPHPASLTTQSCQWRRKRGKAERLSEAKQEREYGILQPLIIRAIYFTGAEKMMLPVGPEWWYSPPSPHHKHHWGQPGDWVSPISSQGWDCSRVKMPICPCTLLQQQDNRFVVCTAVADKDLPGTVIDAGLEAGVSPPSG